MKNYILRYPVYMLTKEDISNLFDAAHIEQADSDVSYQLALQRCFMRMHPEISDLRPIHWRRSDEILNHILSLKGEGFVYMDDFDILCEEELVAMEEDEAYYAKTNWQDWKAIKFLEIDIPELDAEDELEKWIKGKHGRRKRKKS